MNPLLDNLLKALDLLMSRPAALSAIAFRSNTDEASLIRRVEQLRLVTHQELAELFNDMSTDPSS